MATNRQVAERLREFAENSPETPAPKDRSSGNMTVRAPTFLGVDALCNNSRGLFLLRAEAVSYSTVIAWLVWNTHASAYEYWQTPTSHSVTTQGHKSDFRWGVGYDLQQYITPVVDSPYSALPRFDPRAIDVSAFVDTMDTAIGEGRRQWKTRADAITRLPEIVNTIDRLMTHNVPDVARGFDLRETFAVLYDMKATAEHLRSCMTTGELDAKQAVATLRGAYALAGAWKDVK